jgi:uncharacterized protein with HEPN domain
MIAVRNITTHEYFGIDLTIIWQIVKADLPVLKLKIAKLLSK